MEVLYTLGSHLPNWILLVVFLAVAGTSVVIAKVFIEEKMRSYIRKSKGRRIEDVPGDAASWLDRLIDTQEKHIAALSDLHEVQLRATASMKDICAALQGVLATQEEIAATARLYKKGEGVCHYPNPPQP